MPALEERIILKMSGITKTFPGVVALESVDLEVKEGEIHAVVGENGAGKSTLMNILGGILQPDTGEIVLDGTPVTMKNPHAAQEAGISFIHQELASFPNMSVTGNLFVESFPNKGGFIAWKELHRKTVDILGKIMVDLSPTTQVSSLRIGERQMLEIARALLRKPKILVLDEPTSSLTEKETEILFNLMKDLAAQGVSIIYISHRLEEIFQVCHRATVLRDGHHVGTVEIDHTSKSQLISMIVGRELSDFFPKYNVPSQEILMRVENFSHPGIFEEINFSLCAGEIVGLTGLMGSGCKEIARAMFGIYPVDRGEIHIDGKPVAIKSPEDAIQNGIGFVTDDRLGEGLVLEKTVRDNIVLACLRKFASQWGWVNREAQEQATQKQIKDLRIATPGSQQFVKYLSGGTQQKVVVGKWLVTEPRIFILDEPTRGIDVGAKAEIHEIISNLASEGKAILLISSELPEILGMSDRIFVVRDGRIAAQFNRAEARQEKILAAATGGE